MIVSAFVFVTLATTAFSQWQQCRQWRVRKEVNDLTESEWRRLINAIVQIRSRDVPSRFESNEFIALESQNLTSTQSHDFSLLISNQTLTSFCLVKELMRKAASTLPVSHDGGLFLNELEKTYDLLKDLNHAMNNSDTACPTQSLSLFEPAEAGNSIFDQLAQLHRRRQGEVHDVPVFLPWHRYYTYQFESALREIDSEITLPYWDWSLESDAPHKSIVWRYFGNSAATRRNFRSDQDAPCINDGPFRSWRFDEDCIRRAFSPQNGRSLTGVMVSKSCLDRIKQRANDFVTFQELFVVPHNFAHFWIGGSMASSSTAANDPIFFVHHAFIDKVWHDWQMENPRQRLYDYGASDWSDRAELSSPLPGFRGKNVGDVMDNNVLCVRYADPVNSARQRRVSRFNNAMIQWPTNNGTQFLHGRMGMDQMEMFQDRENEVRRMC